MKDNWRERIEADILGFLVHSEGQRDKLAVIELLESKALFTVSAHQAIYEACVRLFIQRGQCDVVSVGMEVPANLTGVVTALPYKEFGLEAIKKAEGLVVRGRLERLYGLVTRVKAELDTGGVNGQMKQVEDFIFNEYRTERKSSDLVAVTDSLLERAGSEKHLGFDWIGGVPSLREKTGGIEPGKLYVIGGVKKTGKTRVAVAIMKRLIEQNQEPLFVSMEMRDLEVGKMFLSAFSGINTAAFQRRMSPAEIETMKIYRDQFVGKLHLDCESFLSLESLRAKLWRAQARGARVVVIDYLQRMNFPESKSRNYATTISDAAARIADMARDYGVAVILLSQLRNEAEDEPIADMRFLKDSGGIAEAADCVVILTNKQRQAKGEAKYVGGGKAKLWFSIEQRAGETALVKTEADLGKFEFEEYTEPIPGQPPTMKEMAKRGYGESYQ